MSAVETQKTRSEAENVIEVRDLVTHYGDRMILKGEIRHLGEQIVVPLPHGSGAIPRHMTVDNPPARCPRR